MIVLDTNVISEFTRPNPTPKVICWLDSLGSEQVVVTAVTVAELLYGVARMPAGKRKAALATKIIKMLAVFFGSQALAFTMDAAAEYADIVASRELQGRPIDPSDAQIAAICRLNGATLATRNVRDFAATGVHVIDPWTA